MRFTIASAHEWLAALRRINRAADDSSRGLTGIYAHVRVQAKGHSVELLARDEVVAAVTTLPLQEQAEGGCCIPLRLLKLVLEAAPTAPIDVRLEGDRTLRFDAPRWHRSIAVLDASRMPDIPPLPQAFACMSRDVVRQVIVPTVHAADTDPDRVDRACVVLRRSAAKLEAFASDGHRAAYAWASYEGTFSERLTIHQQALREMLQVLDDCSEVHIGEARNHLFFKTNSTIVAVRLPTIAPADFSSMFGKHHPSACRLSRNALIAVLSSAQDTTGSAEATLQLSSHGLVVSATAPSRGTTRDELLGARYGPDAEIKIMTKYLRDAAMALGGDELVLEVGLPLEQLIVRPASDHYAEVVIMPMQPCAPS